VSPPPLRVAPRHWRYPHNFKLEATKQEARKLKKLPMKDTADGALKRVADAKDCRSDGLDPLLRKLNLSPKCE
jgi:hypothetical protein